MPALAGDSVLDMVPYLFLPTLAGEGILFMGLSLCVPTLAGGEGEWILVRVLYLCMCLN